MDVEVAKLVNAFRTELEGCHQYLDLAGVPRGIGDRQLTLKDRIAVLVEADREEAVRGNQDARELRALTMIADQYDEFGELMPQEGRLPPLADRLFNILADARVRARRRRATKA